MFINAGMLVEMLECIENLQNQLKLQATTMEKQGVFIQGAGGDVGKHWKHSKSIGNQSKHNGKVMFINAGMLAEMLERIENIQNQLKILASKMET